MQTLYNGQRSGNLTRQAEASVLASRETLRNIEQTTLLDAVTAYMNVLRDTAILDLQRRNVQVLQEQLKQTRDRFNVGEVTRTDVAQAESRLAAGRSQLLTAESNYVTSKAQYRQVIGVEAPSAYGLSISPDGAQARPVHLPGAGQGEGEPRHGPHQDRGDRRRARSVIRGSRLAVAGKATARRAQSLLG